MLLQPGDSVRLDLAGAPPADHMVLRVWVADDEPSVPVAVFPLAKPVPRILEGLPIGTYDIRFEIQMTRSR